MALITGGAAGERLLGSTGPDTIYGAGGNDYIIGLDGDDILFGETGNDRLFGREGDDRLYGGTGADYIAAASGDDLLFGGGGDDNLLAAVGDDLVDGGDGDDRLVGGGGDDALTGGEGDDRLLGNGGLDTLYGGEGADVLVGSGGTDLLFGGAGDDRMRGGGGDDLIFGGSGDDRLSGESGDDTLAPGGGSDLLLGGAGADRASYEEGQADLYIALEDDGDVTVTGLTGDTDDTLREVEFLSNADFLIDLAGGAESSDLGTSAASAGAAMAVGTRFTGEIGSAGDEDWIAVTLLAGVTYQIELLGADSENGTLRDPYLAIFDANGLLIAENDDSGLGVDSNYIFRPDESGLYYVSASSFFASDTGTYTLSVTAPEDDFPGTLPTDNTLAIGESATGEIQFDDDLDLFAVELVAGARYTIQVRGADAYGGTLDDPFVSLLDAKGNTVAADDDGGIGSTSRISYTATETGTFYIEVDTDDEREYGTYTVSIVQNTPASTAADLMALAGGDQPEPQDGPGLPAMPGWAGLQASIVHAHLDADLNPVAAVIHSEPADWF